MANVQEITPLLGSTTENKSKKAPQFIAGLSVCLVAIVAGFVLGYSSPTIEDLKEENLLQNKSQASWYGSLVAIGAIFGGPAAGFLVEYVGRKTTIMLTAVPYTVGFLLLAYAPTYLVLYAGRLLTGLACGMCSLSVPLYIGEVTSKQYRGTIGSCFQLSVVVGVLAAYLLGIPLKWAWLAISASVLSAISIVVISVLPETPAWLMSKNLENEASSALKWLRGPTYNIDDEFDELQNNLDSQSQGMTISDLQKRNIYRPFIISLFLMIFQQFSGINAIIFYSKTIFQTAGFEGSGSIPSVIVASVQVVATGVACVLMDIAGRRILLLIAGTFMTLSCASFGLFYYLTIVLKTTGINWLSLLSLVVYIIAFSIGWGPIPWLLMGEIFPSKVKGIASGVATLVNWTCAFLVTFFFMSIEDLLTNYGTFWLFSSICLASTVFVFLFLPETKGKSLEEIETEFKEGPLLVFLRKPQVHQVHGIDQS